MSRAIPVLRLWVFKLALGWTLPCTLRVAMASSVWWLGRGLGDRRSDPNWASDFTLLHTVQPGCGPTTPLKHGGEEMWSRNFGSRSRWVGSFIPQRSLHLRKELSPPPPTHCPFDKRLSGSQSRTGHAGEERNILFQPGIESPPLVCLTWTDMIQSYFSKHLRTR